MVNFDRNPISSDIVEQLLRLNGSVVDVLDKKMRLPLHLLATRSAHLSQDQVLERRSATECFAIYLEARPMPSRYFMAALQDLPGQCIQLFVHKSLPFALLPGFINLSRPFFVFSYSFSSVEWLRDRAVVHPIVQEMINGRMARRFPTFITIIDFFLYVIVLITYSIEVPKVISSEDVKMKLILLASLYSCAFWFTSREIVQMISLRLLGHFRKGWLNDANNWLDVTFILIIVSNIVTLQTGMHISPYFFRTMATLSLTVLWINLMVCSQYFVSLAGLFATRPQLIIAPHTIGIILVQFSYQPCKEFSEGRFLYLYQGLNVLAVPSTSFIEPHFPLP